MHSTRSTCQPPPKIKLYPSFYLRIIILRQKKLKEESAAANDFQLMDYQFFTTQQADFNKE
jgi:hypothetical protein